MCVNKSYWRGVIVIYIKMVSCRYKAVNTVVMEFYLTVQGSECSGWCIKIESGLMRSAHFSSIDHCIFALMTSQLWAFLLFVSSHNRIEYWTMHVSCWKVEWLELLAGQCTSAHCRILNKWIRRELWPSHSSDLSMCDFYLWGNFKWKVYGNK
jgi:hypothetical protein